MTLKRLFIYKSIFFFLLTFLACSPDNEVYETDIPPVENLNLTDLEEINIPPVLFKERALVVTDNFLISQSVTVDTLFRVFDRFSLEYLGGFGKKGGGPEDYGEFITSFRRTRGDTIQVTNFKQIRLIKISRISEGQQGFSADVVKRVTVPAAVIPWNGAFQINDSLYAGEATQQFEKEFNILNANTGEITEQVSYPAYAENIPPKYDQVLYQRRFRYATVQKKVVTFYSFFPNIRIYDFETNTDLNIYLKSEFEQSGFEEKGDGLNLIMDDKYLYYLRLELSDQHIYAYYEVYSWEDSQYTSQTNKQLHVFDYKGNFVRNIGLEDWMNLFTVSPDDANLYFWHDNREDRIFRYSLNGLL